MHMTRETGQYYLNLNTENNRLSKAMFSYPRIKNQEPPPPCYMLMSALDLRKQL